MMIFAVLLRSFAELSILSKDLMSINITMAFAVRKLPFLSNCEWFCFCKIAAFIYGGDAHKHDLLPLQINSERAFFLL